MSRDRAYEVPLDRGPHHEPAGREMPRGGRAGGSGRRSRPGPEDVRDVLTQQLALPRGDVRERVFVGDRSYVLRGSEARLLAAVGAFRVALERDLLTKRTDRWHGDLEQLRDKGLVQLQPHLMDGHRSAVVTLTRDGLELLEAHRRPDAERASQSFYAGVVKPRELSHDAQLYRAYVEAAERLHASGARVERVVLDYELKREYQRFLQHNNRARHRRSGRPDRTRAEIDDWAKEHTLPVVRDRVQFPDVRIEFERPDGTRDREDIELATEHYNGRQMAAKQASGFTLHRQAAGRLRLNGSSSKAGRSPFDPAVAEGVIR